MAKKKAKKKFRKKHWSDVLVRMGACRSAVRWCRGFPSLKAAWKACDREDWMDWLSGALAWGPRGSITAKYRRFAQVCYWRPCVIRRFWPNPPAMSRLERCAKEYTRGA